MNFDPSSYTITIQPILAGGVTSKKKTPITLINYEGVLVGHGSLVELERWEFPACEGQPFVSYDDMDKRWAIPLGFGRWVKTVPMPGDMFRLQDYSRDFQGRAVVLSSSCSKPDQGERFQHIVRFRLVPTQTLLFKER